MSVGIVVEFDELIWFPALRRKKEKKKKCRVQCVIHISQLTKYWIVTENIYSKVCSGNLNCFISNIYNILGLMLYVKKRNSDFRKWFKNMTIWFVCLFKNYILLSHKQYYPAGVLNVFVVVGLCIRVRILLKYLLIQFYSLLLKKKHKQYYKEIILYIYIKEILEYLNHNSYIECKRKETIK